MIKKSSSLSRQIIREFSSGGIVYKRAKGQEGLPAQAGKRVKILWLIAKSAPSKDYPQTIWRLPKGWLDDENKGKNPEPLASGERKATEDDLRKAALREVAEEGGVKAKIVKKIGTERFFYVNSKKERVLKFVTFYLMMWEKDLPHGPGSETSEIAWLSYQEAHQKLTHGSEKKILTKTKITLDSEIQESLI